MSIKLGTVDLSFGDLSGYVKTTGDQTIAGIKTFSSSPIVPAPTTDMQVATKKYVDDNAGGGESTQSTFTAGEDITTGNALRLGTNKTLILNNNNGTGELTDGIGRSTTLSRSGARLEISNTSTLTSIVVSLKRTSSLFAGEMEMTVHSNIPTGASSNQFLVATASNTINMNAVTTTPNNFTFNFSNEILNSGTYYIQIRRQDGAHSSSQFTYWMVATTGGTPNLQAYTVNTSGTFAELLQSGFTTRRNCIVNLVDISENNQKVYKASNQVDSRKFLGFASETKNADENIIIDTTGVNKNFSGLIIDQYYQLSGTPGFITAGTTYKVGRAISPTSILINHNL